MIVQNRGYSSRTNKNTVEWYIMVISAYNCGIILHYIFAIKIVLFSFFPMGNIAIAKH